jgi:hypothetical protein
MCAAGAPVACDRVASLIRELRCVNARHRVYQPLQRARLLPPAQRMQPPTCCMIARASILAQLVRCCPTSTRDTVGLVRSPSARRPHRANDPRARPPSTAKLPPMVKHNCVTSGRWPSELARLASGSIRADGCKISTAELATARAPCRCRCAHAAYAVVATGTVTGAAARGSTTERRGWRLPDERARHNRGSAQGTMGTQIRWQQAAAVRMRSLRELIPKHALPYAVHDRGKQRLHTTHKQDSCQRDRIGGSRKTHAGVRRGYP